MIKNYKNLDVQILTIQKIVLFLVLLIFIFLSSYLAVYFKSYKIINNDRFVYLEEDYTFFILLVTISTAFLFFIFHVYPITAKQPNIPLFFTFIISNISTFLLLMASMPYDAYSGTTSNDIIVPIDIIQFAGLYALTFLLEPTINIYKYILPTLIIILVLAYSYFF
jgi:hypothetical protein